MNRSPCSSAKAVHRHRRQLACLAAGDEDVARRRARLAAVEAVGRVVAAVGADRQRRLSARAARTRARRRARRAGARRRPSRARGRSARSASGRSASISSTGWLPRLASGFETPSRPSRLDARAPAADEHLGRAERPAVLVVAAPGDQRRAALAGRDHAVGHDRRERAHDRVVDAVADHAARAARGRQHRVDDRAARAR